jgi:hypothetical protein
MPLFKVTMKVEIKRTYVAYVDAADEDAADRWASKVEDEASVGNVVGEDDHWGQIEDIEPVSEVPNGYKSNVA